jgi:hypothetical protein
MCVCVCEYVCVYVLLVRLCVRERVCVHLCVCERTMEPKELKPPTAIPPLVRSC